MNRILPTLLLLLAGATGFAQGFSLTDSSITFKNSAGDVLGKDSLMAFVSRGPFSTQTEILPDGRKIITLSRPDEAAARRARLDEYAWAFRHRGTQLPPFSFRDRSGRSITPDSLRGTVTIVNFWFTQCKPCIAEMPELNKLVAGNAGKNVQFLAPTFEPPAAVTAFLGRFPFGFRIVPGQKDYLDRLGFGTFPTTLVIDRRGVIRDVFIGADNELGAKLQVAIDRLLTEQ